MSFNNLSVGARSNFLLAVFAVSFLGYGWWSHNTLETAKVRGPSYQQIVQGKDLVADILPPPEYLVETHLYVTQLRDLCEIEAEKSEMEALIKRLTKLKSEYNERHDFWIKELPETPLKKAFLVDAYEPANEYLRVMDSEFIPACLTRNSEKARELCDGTLQQKFEAHRTAIDKSVILLNDQIVKVESEVDGMLSSRNHWSIALVFVTLATTGAFGWYSSRSTVMPLKKIAAVMQAVEKGDLSQRTGVTTGGELGQISKAVDSAIETLQATTLKSLDATYKLLAIDKSNATIEFQLDGTIVTANQNFLTTLGYTLDEIKGRHHSMFVDEKTRQSPEYKEFWTKLGRGEFCTGEFKRIAKGGREVWIQASYNPIVDINGRPAKVVKYASDISEIVKFKFEAGRVNSMIEQAPVNIMFADRDLKIQYMNPASTKTLKTLESILPIRADQMIGQNIDIFHKRPEHQRKLLSDPSNLPHRANISLGKETLDLLVSPVFDQNKNYLGAMVTWEVITAKLAMEQQIKENAEREKAQAEELTAKVAQIVEVANLVAQCDYSKQITVAGSDAIGQLGEGLAAFFKDKQAGEAKEKERSNIERKQAEEQRQKVATVLDIVNNVAKGDFALQVPDLGDDAVGQVAKALGQAVGAVRGTMEEVREVAETVATAAQQLSGVSETIASGAQEQASSLEETASSLEEITSTVKQNTDNAQQARQLATSSRDLAEKGGQVVKSAVEAMGAINQASRQIADIITTIDEIAFQTNLLALNAAVEAARAGEQGRGFAVVAAEVRNLAQRSASAAKEIKNLIQDSGRKVDSGTELVNKSGQTLDEIVTSGKRVADIVTEIAAASKEQLVGIEQVNTAVTQMDQVTQTSAGQTEEMSRSSQSLVANAEQLRELVGRFNLGDRNTSSQSGSSEGRSHRPVAKSVPTSNRNGSAKLRRGAANLSGKPSGSRQELDSIGSKSGADENGFVEF